MKNIDVECVLSLWTRAQHGDRAAFAEFFAKTSPTYFGIARHIFPDGNLSEALLEEFYVTIALNPARSQSAMASIKAVFGSAQRGGQRQARCDDLTNAHHRRLLTTEEKRGLYLSYFFGLNREQIAHFLNCDVAHVSELLRHGAACLAGEQSDGRKPESGARRDR